MSMDHAPASLGRLQLYAVKPILFGGYVVTQAFKLVWRAL